MAQIFPKDYISDAPCWWEVADDGATFRCHACEQRDHASHMVITLIPKGDVQIMHRECVDEWWMQRAKKMPGKV